MPESEKPKYVERGIDLYTLEDRGTRVIIVKNEKSGLWKCKIERRSGCHWYGYKIFKDLESLDAAKAEATKEFPWL